MSKAKKRKPTPKSKKRILSANVGFLLAAKLEDWQPYIDAFTQELLKKIPSANIVISPPKGADGDTNTIDTTADYLAQHYDIIVTAGTYAALSCQRATKKYPKSDGSLTPFVFASVGDPAGSRLVPQPADNFCGGNNKQVLLVPKRVDHMMKTKKYKDPIAVVGNPIGSSGSAMNAAFSNLAGAQKSVQISPITPDSNFSADSFINGLVGIQTLYVCSDVLVTRVATDLADAAKAAKMKTMWEFKEHKSIHHGDAAYGVDFADLFTTAADAVADILKGVKTPGQIGIWTAPDGPA